MNFEKLLDELYALTLIEEERHLNEGETARYLYLVDTLEKNNVVIDFGINI